MAEGGYEPVPREDPDETDPTESEPRRTDEGDWSLGRRPREHRSSSRHQYKTKNGSSTGITNPSYEEDEDEDQPPPPPVNANESWRIIKGSKGAEYKINVGLNAINECELFLNGIYRDPDFSKLRLAITEFGEKLVKLPRKGSKYYYIKGDGTVIGAKVPKGITDALGETRIDNASALDAEETELKRQSKEGNAEDEEGRPRSELEVAERLREIEDEREQIVEGMSLTEKVKYYFKKYGFTVVGILTAIGAVIGSILSNLKTGLAKVAKGVGNGLKDLGAKLAGILPGMVGAIAKFLFDTAGEVVGFLAEHAWVLIVGLVVLAVESLKKKYGKKK